MRSLIFIFSLFIAVLTVSCESDDSSTIRNGYNDIYNLPEIPYNYSNPSFPNTFTPYVFGFDNTPSDNIISDHGVTLGRVLFYDKNYLLTIPFLVQVVTNKSLDFLITPQKV